MGIQSSLEHACSKSEVLRRAVDELTVAVTEDHPLSCRTSQSGALEEKVRDMQLVAQRLENSLASSCTRGRKPLDEILARRQLGDCSYLFSELFAFYAAASLDAFRMAAELEEGKCFAEWSLWMGVLQMDLARCLTAFQECAQAIFACWGELAERLSPLPSVLLPVSLERI